MMKRLLRMACFLVLGLTPVLSAMAADTDCAILKELVIGSKSRSEEVPAGGVKAGACNGRDAVDVAGKAGETARDTDPASVQDKIWQWEETITPAEKIMVQNPERYTIRLTKEGRLQARFDCNRGGGDYTVSAGRLSFGPMLSTRMACPADSLDGSFMRDLEKVESFFVRNGKLFLKLQGDGGAMHFCPSP